MTWKSLTWNDLKGQYCNKNSIWCSASSLTTAWLSCINFSKICTISSFLLIFLIRHDLCQYAKFFNSASNVPNLCCTFQFLIIINVMQISYLSRPILYALQMKSHKPSNVSLNLIHAGKISGIKCACVGSTAWKSSHNFDIVKDDHAQKDHAQLHQVKWSA